MRLEGYVEINNLGNTPASLLDLTTILTDSNVVDASDTSAMHFFDFPPITNTFPINQELGQKSSRPMRFVILGLLNDADLIRFHRDNKPGSGVRGQFILRATLAYLDIFGQKRNTSWCWLDATGSVYPVTCGFDWRRNFAQFP